MTAAFVAYFFFAAIVGVIAASWNRSGFLWFLLSLVISPLLGTILLLIGGKQTDRDSDKPRPWTHVTCPDCGEFVRKDARVCRYCGCKLVPASEVVAQRDYTRINDYFGDQFLRKKGLKK